MKNERIDKNVLVNFFSSKQNKNTYHLHLNNVFYFFGQFLKKSNFQNMCKSNFLRRKKI